MKKICLLATGGTIASEAGANGLRPQVAADRMLRLLPELKDFPLGGGAVYDEVVETCFKFRERAVAFVPVVFLPEACVEACFAAVGFGELRVAGDKTRNRLLCANSHWTALLSE